MVHEAATPADARSPLTISAKRVGKRLLVIFENRLALAMVELHEEREKILRALWFVMISGVCFFLAGVTLTALIAVAFWGNHPIVALVVLMAIYLGVAVIGCVLLAQLQRAWKTLPATIEQLKKDSEWLEHNLS